jgi:hypothetical protein
MAVLGAAVVVTFEMGATTYAAAWDGGEWATLHVVDDGRYGPPVERWQMFHPALGHPVVECTPNGLLEVVQFRLADAAHQTGLIDVVGRRAPVPLKAKFCWWGVPEFSAN